MIRAVVFDVGETLIDETRDWGDWADWLGVPRFAFFGTLGAVIERGEHHRRVFEWVRPGFDFESEVAKRREAGSLQEPRPLDFYPDARPCLEALVGAGYQVGLVGNQPAWMEAALEAEEVAVDWIASSAGWGVEKPSPDFFARVVDQTGMPAGEIAYVGDRLDNDVLPACRAGLVGVFLRRGPWGFVHATRPEAGEADIRLESLAELPDALALVSSAGSP